LSYVLITFNRSGLGDIRSGKFLKSVPHWTLYCHSALRYIMVDVRSLHSAWGNGSRKNKKLD